MELPRTARGNVTAPVHARELRERVAYPNGLVQRLDVFDDQTVASDLLAAGAGDPRDRGAHDSGGWRRFAGQSIVSQTDLHAADERKGMMLSAIVCSFAVRLSGLDTATD
jgi:hypothetical protein